MQIDQFHLTYCTNIHAADGWDGVFANLQNACAGPQGALLAGGAVRRWACASPRVKPASCSRAIACASSARFLDREGLYVAIINGFPYGPFHGTPVKANVYAPDWRDTPASTTRSI